MYKIDAMYIKMLYAPPTTHYSSLMLTLSTFPFGLITVMHMVRVWTEDINNDYKTNKYKLFSLTSSIHVVFCMGVNECTCTINHMD